MGSSITGLKKQYSLDETGVRRLNSEYELISLRIDFCLHKAEDDKRSLYDLLVFYGGLERFTCQLTDDKKDFLRNDIEVYNAKVQSDSFNKNDRTKLTQILFSSSDYVKDICNGIDVRGCFNYDVWKDEGILLHFTNSVVPVNPLKDAELEKRKEELAEIAKEIKNNEYGARYFFSVSWMWNLDVFRGLVPKEFNESLKEFKESEFYSLGHWGQFFRYDGGLNEKRIKEFRKTWEFPLPILLGECAVDKFLEMYPD